MKMPKICISVVGASIRERMRVVELFSRLGIRPLADSIICNENIQVLTNTTACPEVKNYMMHGTIEHLNSNRSMYDITTVERLEKFVKNFEKKDKFDFNTDLKDGMILTFHNGERVVYFAGIFYSHHGRPTVSKDYLNNVIKVEYGNQVVYNDGSEKKKIQEAIDVLVNKRSEIVKHIDGFLYELQEKLKSL